MEVLNQYLVISVAKSLNKPCTQVWANAVVRLSQSKKQVCVSAKACEILGDAIAEIASPNKGFCLTSPRSQIMGDRYIMTFSEFHL